MATTATETTSLVAFTLPGTPYSVQMARFYVRAALGYHDLGDYAGDVETVTSELVSNAITHASAQAISLESDAHGRFRCGRGRRHRSLTASAGQA